MWGKICKEKLLCEKYRRAFPQRKKKFTLPSPIALKSVLRKNTNPGCPYMQLDMILYKHITRFYLNETLLLFKNWFTKI